MRIIFIFFGLLVVTPFIINHKKKTQKKEKQKIYACTAPKAMQCSLREAKKINEKPSLNSKLITKPSLHKIKSEALGYELQYWVDLPGNYSVEHRYPVLYVTDGLWYKDDGELSVISDQLIREKIIEPIIIVYVDAFAPGNPYLNRRNYQFLCNPDYVKFYREELVPFIDENYSTDKNARTRGMLGLSFGGLNSMFFAIHAHDTFGKIGIQSPAPHPCPDIFSEFEKRDRLPIDIYLSTGTVNDKKRPTRKLKKILDKKGYEFKYQEVAEGHNWKNWKPLLDDVLLYFYKKEN